MAVIFHRITNSNDNPIITAIHKVPVYSFLADDDKDATQRFTSWRYTSPAGEFLEEHSVEPLEFYKTMEPSMLAYKCIVLATLEEKKLSEFYLKFGKT